MPPALLALLAAAQPTWSFSGKADAAVGYKDNLLLSHAGTENSAFARGDVESLLWHPPRLPDGRVDYFAFVKAEGTRYFSSPTVDHEANASVWTEWRYRVGDVFKFSLDAKGFYLDEIFDISDTEVQRTVAQLKVVGGTLGPTLRWTPRPWCWIEVEGDGKRESYRDGLNNGDVREGTLRVGWKPGARFEVSIGTAAQRRRFDRHEQYSVSGRPLTGTLLQTTEREQEGRIEATLDAAAHWKSVTRVSGLHYTDNDSGYFNYRQRRVRQEVEWNSGPWLVRAEGSAKRRDFEVQTVGLGISPPALVKEEFAAELRVERKLSDRWTILAEYSWERSRWNDPIGSYRMNEGLLGGQWSWEK